MTSFYEPGELLAIGFKKIGENVCISRKASIYAPEKMVIGNNVRVDDFCILSGRIELCNNIHIAAYSALYGGEEGIFVEDFANMSSRVSIYSISDDYSGASMTNPTVPEQYKHVISRPVYIRRHVIIGSTSVVLPGVDVKEGSAFGAMTLINRDPEPWTINVGIPFRKIKDRQKGLLEMENRFVQDNQIRDSQNGDRK